MATTYQNRSHPNARKPRTTKPIAQQPPSKITNDSKDIKIRFGNNSGQNSMYKPASILKRKTFERPHSDFDQNLPDWQQSFQTRSVYSPIRTPPRLRRLVTPTGIGLHRNHYNLHRLSSPLPPLDDRYSVPGNLGTWGLDPTDYHLNSNLDLMRSHPSPLSHYGLSNGLQRQKKSYIVVPRLTNLVSPPVSSGSGTFTLPSRRRAPVYVPDSQYTYLDRIHSFASPRIHREPSDYVYLRRNEAFANHYIDDFIGRSIEDQFIPDILLEIIAELDQESKNLGGKSHRREVDGYYTELHRRMNQDQADSTHLFSDDWIRELDHQQPPYPASNKSSLVPLDFNELPPVRATTRVRYNELPPDVQGRLLADINQELIDFEIKNAMAELSGQSLTHRSNNVSVMTNTPRNIHHNQVDQVQHNAIEKYAKDKLLDTTCLDQLIVKYLKQHGSIVDVDDLSRLLDATILDNLTYQYQDIHENRSKTLDNYAAKKFHLNSFMNITMDTLLTELSGSLIEDMKDLDGQERRIIE